MVNQEKLDNNLLAAVMRSKLDKVKLLIAKGADIHSGDDYALKHSVYNHNLDIVKYLIIDCNMTIKEETFNWLKNLNLLEMINKFKLIELHNQLNDNLNINIIDKKLKMKL